MNYKNQNDDVKYQVNIDIALMDRLDEMSSLKQMYGVINDMENREYNASKGAKKSKVSITNTTKLKEYVQRLFWITSSDFGRTLISTKTDRPVSKTLSEKVGRLFRK